MKKNKFIIGLISTIVIIGVIYFGVKLNYNNDVENNTQVIENTVDDEGTEQTDDLYDYTIDSENMYIKQNGEGKTRLRKIETVGKSTYIETRQHLELVGLYSRYLFYDNVLIDKGSFMSFPLSDIISCDDIYTIEDSDTYNGTYYSKVRLYDLKTGKKTYEAEAGVTPFENYGSLENVVGAGNNFICFEDDKFIDLSKPNEIQDARVYLKAEMNDDELYDEYMSIDDEVNGYIDYMFVGRDGENNLLYECRKITDDVLLFGPIKIKLT